MNIYTTTAFEGYYPVGTAAVVTAESAEQAANLLNAHLTEHMAKRSRSAKALVASDFLQMSSEVPTVRILCDGDY